MYTDTGSSFARMSKPMKSISRELDERKPKAPRSHASGKRCHVTKMYTRAAENCAALGDRLGFDAAPRKARDASGLRPGFSSRGAPATARLRARSWFFLQRPYVS